MIRALLDRLSFAPPYTEGELHLRYKVSFLNSVFLMAALVALGMGFYRWQLNPFLGAVDFGFAAASFVALYYLKHHHDKVDLISSFAIWSSYALFFAVYLLAPYNTMRLSLFFLLAAGAFYLKGRREGLRWLLLILSSIIAAHVLTGFNTGYSHIDIVTTCLYLIALFLIFWNYEQIREEQAVRDLENTLQRHIDERWRLALEGAGDAVWDWEIPEHILHYSPSYAAMLGYSQEQLGHHADIMETLLHPNDAAHAKEYLRDFLRGEVGKLYISEQRLRCLDGSYKWILCRGQVTQRDAEGRPRRMLGTHVDITERKLIEASLKENQKRLHLALDSARMGVWELNLITNELYWSPEIYRLFGLNYGSITLDTFRNMVHPDDMAAMESALAKAIAEHTPFFAEFRYGESGNLGWAEDRAEVQYDAAGQPLRVIGTVQNITERKRVQEEILQSRQELAEQRALLQTILDNTPQGIWMLGMDSRLKFINRGFCLSTGISEHQLLSARHYSDVLPAYVAQSLTVSDQACLSQESPHISTVWAPFVDGRDHLLEVTKVRLLNKDGSVRGLIGIWADITERREHERQLEHIAHYDSLTGVPNRVLLADRLAQALARTKREQGLMAVCYLDLDGFKPINDSFGHEIGDKVLVEITRRIKEVIREDDTVARLGGDEFVVLLVGLQAPEECAGSLNRLLDAIHQPIEIQGKLARVSASIGVSLYPEDEHDADTLLRHADQAMYIAKQSGKNRYHLFDAKSDLRARSHHLLLQQIRHGLGQGEFELYYQPKVDLGSGLLVGAEALIRWNHPQRGLLPPAEFLRLIENTELEIELGNWVVTTAIDQLRRWRASGFCPEVSINVSAYHLQSPGFVEHLRTQANQCCPGNCYGTLQVEILETAALDDIEGVSAIIHECREFGMFFALDDFGTGYSSLTYLSNLDVDTLKIDQSFVHNMQKNKGDHAIVQGIIALALAFERHTVAEGVETAQHYQALKEMGCETAQGYFIARPMPASALVEWSKTWQAKLESGQAT